ncbi:MAG: CehA/McbA family metallohydrolase [Sphaerochaetaceae bacterium]
MEELHISKTYNKEEQQSYKRIPFTVGKNIERIEISYDYLRFSFQEREWGIAKEEVNIIDLGLFDPNGLLRGWSGSERHTVYISAAEASPGYKRGSIAAGAWQVALGIYKVTNQVTVNITIKLKEKERRWSKGDLHMHTHNSDGIYTTGEVITYAKHAGLNFIALTDHNNTQQNQEIGNPEGITVLPGMEYTNYRGHANFFFSDTTEFSENPLSNTYEEMLSTIEAARKKGALISINHPFDESCPWLWGFDFPFKLVEVWNGFFKDSDAKASAWWRTQLKEGKRFGALGGSDTHRIEQGRSFGTPTTYLYTYSLGKEDLLAALEEGRISISATPTSAQLDLVIGNAHIGDTVLFEEGLTAEIHINGAKPGDTIVLYSDEGKEQRWKSIYTGNLTLPFEVQKRMFYHAELYRKTLSMELLDAMTNPIYLS